MQNRLLRKSAATGFPNEELLLKSGNYFLYEADSLRVPGTRFLIAIAKDGWVDYPVWEDDKVKFNKSKRFSETFKKEVKKFLKKREDAQGVEEMKEEMPESVEMPKAAGIGPSQNYPKKPTDERCTICDQYENSHLHSVGWRDRHDFAPPPKKEKKYIGGPNMPKQAMNAPQLSPEALDRMYRIQLEGLAQGDCEGTGREDCDCETCEAREELEKLTGKQAAVTPHAPLTCEIRDVYGDVEQVGHVNTTAEANLWFRERGIPFAEVKSYDNGERTSFTYRKSGGLLRRRRDYGEKVSTATIHDLRQLAQELNVAFDFEDIKHVVQNIIRASKEVGARDVLAAARHYLSKIMRREEFDLPGTGGYYTGANPCPARVQRALDRAYKILNSTLVAYIR
jgi:hypothetical protein